MEGASVLKQRSDRTKAVAHNPPVIKTRMGFKRLPSISEAIGHRARRGFSLVEAAIVLAVVGGVIGGIWVGAATLKQRWFEQQFLEGVLVMANNAQKYLTQRDACNGPALNSTSPELWAMMLPKQWTSAGVTERYGGNPGGYVRCEGTRAGPANPAVDPNSKYLDVFFWGGKDAYLCNQLMPKIDAMCNRVGCSVSFRTWTCHQPDGSGWGILFPVGR